MKICIRGKQVNVTSVGVASDGEDPSRGQIERAKTFLSGCARTRLCKAGSYSAKHLAEQATGDYVSNGALIIAASELGFDMRPCHGSPNVLIACDTRVN